MLHANLSKDYVANQLNQIRRTVNNDNKFISDLSGWLGTIGSAFQINGMAEDIYDACEALDAACGADEESVAE
jgi:hypothetical protein